VSVQIRVARIHEQGDGSAMKLVAPIMRIETLIRMKEATGREEDVRQLRQLRDNTNDAQ
jgi:hypothetical protein